MTQEESSFQNLISKYEPFFFFYPQYFKDFSELISNVIYKDNDNSFSLQYKTYYGILASSSIGSDLLVEDFEKKFKLYGGDTSWIDQGIKCENIPKHIRGFAKLNDILVHKPWILFWAHFIEFDNGMTFFLFQSAIILTTIHRFATIISWLNLFNIRKENTNNGIDTDIKRENKDKIESIDDKKNENLKEKYILNPIEYSDFDQHTEQYLFVDDFDWKTNAKYFFSDYAEKEMDFLEKELKSFESIPCEEKKENDKKNENIFLKKNAIEKYIGIILGIKDHSYDYHNTNKSLPIYLKTLIKKIVCFPEKLQEENLKDYSLIFKGKKYDDNNKNIIFNFENGDKVEIVDNRQNELLSLKFHKNVNLNEGDMTKGKLTGILRLILLKYISSCINNINLINSSEIRDIISELKQGIKLEESPEADIKSNLSETSGGNIIAYSNYISSVISDNDIDYLLELVGKSMKNQIIKYWSILSKYEEFNKKFQEELLKAIKNSYFDYSLIGLSIYEQSNRINYLNARGKCPNPEIRYLFHGTQIDPISKIISNGFLYTRKPFYGMGIYFSDMLDYVSFYCGGKDFYSRRDNFGKTTPVNSTFSCVAAEVFYSENEKKEIFDFSLNVEELDHSPTYEEIAQNYTDKMIPINGVNFARVEPNQGQVRNKEDIISDKRKGKFIGTEYVITEKDQILPLYGLTFKRNEYFVLWRDPNFKGQNIFSDYLRERKLFIYQYAKMNAYFESNTEKALEIIKMKKI